MYSQSSAQLVYINDVTGANQQVGIGYSGNGIGLNNPDMQDVPNVGPIPQGGYTIEAQRSSNRTGQGVMDLTPNDGTDLLGRTGSFQIHGDKKKCNRCASAGCIVISPLGIRDIVNLSGDNQLTVVP